ncbi:DegV family protein [Clostridium saccharobutylicum]|uniref:DegV domain-containing protein n=1 Tax=Clostridium saccharobutylicum DSM 13864 TaxID=1345695 RepID=U5MZB9_CLOSA|nr:DegV family protein [Clostridium saccharobutylicum]AGX45006.1 DegV domain-containing protein [Clostridium saccharobutylicum DSM 13864]AQR92288.1 DegV domain-containing protein [Clostridium saccharobutylicum]AQS02190.1 DegV domain-containing protein [Clostridium saccharobutylicum]AQS11794.1 DegV domain-containing protein [Clostridium saccharobutylicum]AQS16173.1 DegV domain-containing protein [Clostridium saccharobutylicum]
MEKIKIITDSTADLSNDIYNKYDIEVLPLLINFEEKSYLDGVEINPKMVFEKIEKEGILPTTAQVIPNRFMESYKKYLDEGYKIISIHMSSAMSGTYQSACIAKEMLESNDIVVIDSQNVTAALGILVLKAAKLRDKGYDIIQIENELNNIKKNVKLSVCFESLEYLVRGGRISKTAGIVGGILGIKLVLDIKDGLMSVKDKIRGTKKAINKIIDDLENSNLDEDVPVILIDVDNVEIKEALKKYMIENNVDFIECSVGSTVSIHSGPHCCGLVFLTK